MEHYQFDKSSRSVPTLRTSKDPKSFQSKSARLWNRTPTNFKMGEVIGRAAKKIIKKLWKEPLDCESHWHIIYS